MPELKIIGFLRNKKNYYLVTWGIVAIFILFIIFSSFFQLKEREWAYVMFVFAGVILLFFSIYSIILGEIPIFNYAPFKPGLTAFLKIKDPIGFLVLLFFLMCSLALLFVGLSNLF